MNFLFNISPTERKVRFCVKLFGHFLTESSSVWVELCLFSSQILLGFFHKISTRNSFWKMFQKLLALQGAPLSRFAKFGTSFCNFILSSYYGEKFIWKFYSNLICFLYPIKEASPKRKHRKRYQEEKPGSSIFGKNKFSSFVCFLSVTYYVLFLGCLDLKLLPDIPYCVYWDVVGFQSSNSFHKICNEFFIHHCHDWKEGSFLCETVSLFSNWLPIRLSWNFSRFVQNSIGILP